MHIYKSTKMHIYTHMQIYTYICVHTSNIQIYEYTIIHIQQLYTDTCIRIYNSTNMQVQEQASAHIYKHANLQ